MIPPDAVTLKLELSGTQFFSGWLAWDDASVSLDAQVITKYNYAGGQRVAVRKGNELSYLLGDHLALTGCCSRYNSGALPTKYTYTGQYSNMSDFGLMYYNARWYDPALGRFTSADTLIPEPGSVAAWDRYAYVRNNPLRYTDPSGHMVAGEWKDQACIGIECYLDQELSYPAAQGKLSESGDAVGFCSMPVARETSIRGISRVAKVSIHTGFFMGRKSEYAHLPDYYSDLPSDVVIYDPSGLYIVLMVTSTALNFSNLLPSVPIEQKANIFYGFTLNYYDNAGVKITDFWIESYYEDSYLRQVSVSDGIVDVGYQLPFSAKLRTGFGSRVNLPDRDVDVYLSSSRTLTVTVQTYCVACFQTSNGNSAFPFQDQIILKPLPYWFSRQIIRL